MKDLTDPERPLPFASVWCSGPAAEVIQEIRSALDDEYQPKVDGGPANLAYQLQLIADEHHVLPVVDTYLPYDDNLPTDWVWRIDGDYPAAPSACTTDTDCPNKLCVSGACASELSLLETKMASPMQQLAALYLPVTVLTVQPEDMIEALTLPWAVNGKDDLFYCPPFPSRHPDTHGGCFYSPFANAATYYNMGVALAQKNQLVAYQTYYPDPPAVLLLNNNENDRLWSFLDAMADPRAQPFVSTDYMDVSPGASDPNAALKKDIDQRWTHLFRELQRGFDEGLVDRTTEDWRDARIWHVAYHSTPLSHRDSVYNTVFKPDLSIYQPCCGTKTDAQCRAAMAPSDPSVAPLVCYHPQAAPRLKCKATDASIADCRKPAAARASLAQFQEDLANLLDEPSQHVPTTTMYQSNHPADVDEMRRAYHFADDSWPESIPAAPTVDKIYRMWTARASREAC
ncbi:MAG: hypothetical protein R3F14_31425 [Polyangiaceae bacterium]